MDFDIYINNNQIAAMTIKKRRRTFGATVVNEHVPVLQTPPHQYPLKMLTSK
jgi:hypothetical protein